MGRRARRREDHYLPVLVTWHDGGRKAEAVAAGFEALPAAWDAEAEQRIFARLFDVFAHRRHHATNLPPVAPTVAEALTDPTAMTLRLGRFDPDFPIHVERDLLECHDEARRR